LSDETRTELLKRIAEGSARVGALGLGYVGLPLSMEFVRAGLEVVGFDVAAERVASLNRGESHVQDVPSGRVREAVEAGRFRATGDFGEISGMDALIICVPTPLS